MKPKTITLRIFQLTVLLLGLQQLNAQQPDWGFAPEIYPTLQSNILTYYTIDYRTITSHSNSHSSISGFKYDQGIVAWKISNGNTGFSSYDINLQQFVTDYMSSGGSYYVIADGIVVAYQGSSFVAATYDPTLQVWKKETLSNFSPIGTMNSQGIVSWKNANNEIFASVYDPFYSTWMSQKLTNQNYGGWVHHAGMVTWIGQVNNLGTAFYDFESHAWRIENHSTNNTTKIEANSGVVAWADFQNNVFASIFDLDLDAWVQFQFPTTTVYNTISITAGTIYFQDGGGSVERWGYDTNTKIWRKNTFTQPSCKIIVYQPNAASPSTIFTTSKFIGANNCDYAFGDLSYSKRQMTYKQYQFGGAFEIKNRLSQLGQVTECATNIVVSGPTATAPILNAGFTYGPNPSSSNQSLSIETDKPCKQVRILSIEGKVMCSQAMTGTKNMLDLSQFELGTGIYLIEVEFSDKEIARNRLVVVD